MPGIDRSDLMPGLRLLGFRRRVTIVFRVRGEKVTILRVLYGGRSADVAFGDHKGR
jgi:toxin ParE1/3/4